MNFTHVAAVAMGRALGKVRAGDRKLASRRLGRESARTLEVTSPAFQDGAPLPVSSTADGAGTAPEIRWSNLPAETRSVVVMCEDPDAPFPKPFVHWIVYGVSPSADHVGGGAEGTWTEGKNSKLTAGFTGAAPPPGHGVHHYHFQVFALDSSPGFLDSGLGRDVVEHHLMNRVLAWGELVGTYERV